MHAVAVFAALALCLAPTLGLPHSTLHSILQRDGPLFRKSHTVGKPVLAVPHSSATSPTPTPVPEQYFNAQILDHFNGADTRTWSQRYFVRQDFWDGTGPVFLCVGGEGPPLDGTVLTASVHCNDAVELAPAVHALLFAVEHRYYGNSIPTPDLSTGNLRWLSAHQALGDLAHFHQYAMKQYNISASSQWVTFGGSYPGMLSGWFRYKFPHLISASVSSSSPTTAQVNFEGYNNVVAASMSAPIVGGSPQCNAAITQGHATIGQMLATRQGRDALAAQFNICNRTALEWVENQADWAGNGVVYLPAQENDPSCTQQACNISGICQIMLDDALGTPLQRLAYLSNLQNGNECVDVDHNQVIESLTNTTIAGGTGRVWFYQTCTEFAFYQTCDPGTQCPYTVGLNTLQYNLDQCVVAFNITGDTVYARANYSNAYWGADKPAGSKILFPNGSIDPWHALGVLQSPNPMEPTLWVEGASHHFWTHPSLPTDSAEVIAARKAIWNQVMDWLQVDS